MQQSYWVFGLSAALPNMTFQLTPLALRSRVATERWL
jgi:hypothetical protein